MNYRFSKLLMSVVEAIIKKKYVEHLKHLLVALKFVTSEELKTISCDTELIEYLRDRCCLSNFDLLTTLVGDKDFKFEKRLKKELVAITKERDDFYKTILASDFAKQAIEDHKTLDNQREVRELITNPLYLFIISDGI